MRTAIYAVCLSGGLALLIYPLVGGRVQVPPWSKFAVALLGVSGIGWAFSDLRDCGFAPRRRPLPST